MKEKRIPLKLEAARIKLQYSSDIFGPILYGLPCEERDDIGTMCTDGKKIYYNEQFVEKHTVKELIGVLVHEVWHVVLKHVSRHYMLAKLAPNDEERAKIHAKFNIAADYVINPLVLQDGFTLPNSALHNKDYAGKSVEQVMKLLPDPKIIYVGGKATCKGKDGQIGDVMAPPDMTDQKADDHDKDVEQAVRQAIQNAKARGTVPGTFEKLLRDWDEAKVDWRSRLWRVTDLYGGFQEEDVWVRPNRRYIPHGMYLPTAQEFGPGIVVTSVDTSGSVSDEEIKMFMREINGIIQDTKPHEVYLIQCDHAIQKVDKFENGEELPDEFKVKGRGGTTFDLPFKYLRDQNIHPNYHVYLTDGECSFPKEEPDYPVIWVITNKNITAPWGITIHIS